jgi:peptidyl-prolyl cis-trans isomerase A (cyclophilin A)
MRTPRYHRFAAVFLATFLGWSPAEGGRIAGFHGPPPQQTRTVQAPPLQAPADVPAPGNPVVVVSTSFGDITLELFKDRAPVSVENFLRYVNDGFYSDTVFHRVKKGFMIQGGGYTATLVEKPTRPPIQNEATNGLHNARGTVGMARRPALRSATSQFYINVVDNRILDHTGFSPSDFGYAVFGRVLSGMDVADRIVAVPTTTKDDMEDVPVEPVIIKGARVVK